MLRALKWRVMVRAASAEIEDASTGRVFRNVADGGGVWTTGRLGVGGASSSLYAGDRGLSTFLGACDELDLFTLLASGTGEWERRRFLSSSCKG